MSRRLHRTAKSVKDVYRGYMPIDLPQHRPPVRIKPWYKVIGRPRVTVYPKTEIEGFSEEPEYPPLNDGSLKGLKTQIRLDWYESLKALPTIDAKLHEIGRHAEHYVAQLNNWIPAYNSLPMAQYLTQTNLINSLPDSYKTSNLDNPAYVGLLKKLEQAILNQVALDKYESIKGKPDFVSKTIRDGNRQPYVSNHFIQNLVSGFRKIMALEINPQVFDYQVDLSPAIRSWWYHSGFEAPNNKVFYKSRKDDLGNINQMIQVNGSSAVNWRSSSSFEPILSQTDPIVTDTSLIQQFKHPLKQYGARFSFKWPVALPGFWMDDKPQFDFPHTCFLSTDCLRLRQLTRCVEKRNDDSENCLNSQAILTAFSWLNGLSLYHGYTPFQELDYPFTCQVITTNGKDWLFNVYQLNCHTFHRDLGGPKKNNICWSSGIMQLYESYEDGQFKGVNGDLVKIIARFLAQKTNPEYTSQLKLRQYLSDDTRTEEEKNTSKKYLRRQYEHRVNRWLRHDWKVPLWEHIFFRSKENRHRITHMKPRWHIPKPKYPKIFD